MDSGQETVANIDPNVLIEMIKGWVPGLIDFGIRLLLAVLLLFVGGRLIKVVKNFCGEL